MALERLGQVTGETNDTSEFIVIDGLALGSPTISSTKAHTGTYSIRAGHATECFGLGFPSTTQIRSNYFLNHSGPYSGGEPVLFAWDGDFRSTIEWDSVGGVLELVIDGVQVDTTSPTVIQGTDTWYSLGLSLFTDGVAGFVTFYVDGIAVLTYSGNTGTYVNAVYAGGEGVQEPITGGWNSYAYLDDFYVDSAVGEADAPPASKRFLYTPVNGNGTDSDWTGSDGDSVDNYLLVNNVPIVPAEYVVADAAALKDGYTVAPTTIPVGYEIVAEIPIAVAYRLDVGVPSTVKLYSYDGATYQASGEKTLPADSGVIFDRQETQPDGGSWDESSLNAMEFGVESSGTY
jgi:hypothetical protein